MRITIIGLGLIGGSIGMAIRRTKGREVEIVGFARRQEVAQRAISIGAVDRTQADLVESVKGSSLIIICTPVRTIEGVLCAIAPHAAKDCLVTDTASTKERVMEWASQQLAPRGIDFVGGHPMAGKEKQGIDAADPDMLARCAYCLSPASWTSPAAAKFMEHVVSWVGARPMPVEPKQHDFLVAGISHLPTLVSAAIVDVTTRSSDWPMMAKLAATGYRDMTRLASGSPKVNADMFATNRAAMLQWIDKLNGVLGELREMIACEESDLEDALWRACKAREDWLEEKTGKKLAH